MKKDEKKTHSEFHCDQTNESQFHWRKIQKLSMGKDEKMHSKLDCDQANGSLFKIGGAIFVAPVLWGRGEEE